MNAILSVLVGKDSETYAGREKKGERYQHGSSSRIQDMLKLWLEMYNDHRKKEFWPRSEGQTDLGPCKNKEELWPDKTAWCLDRIRPGALGIQRPSVYVTFPSQDPRCPLSQCNSVNKLTWNFIIYFRYKRKGNLLLFTCLHRMYSCILPQRKNSCRI